MGRDTSFHDSVFRGQSGESTYKPNLVFVIISFSEALIDSYSAIQDECAKIGLRSLRANDGVGSGFIIKDIYSLIEEAEFIVADLTEEKPNVYYELGYAHGVGNEGNDILLVAKEGTKLHFDIAPLRVQFYSSIDHLRQIISSQLIRMINATR
jgi:hypothetical protein